MIDVTNQVDRIFTRSTFNEFVMEALGVETMLAPIDLDVMLKFLARDRQVLAYDDQASISFPASDLFLYSP